MISFSNAITYSGIGTFSPDSQYFAISKSLDVIIYNSSTLKQVQRFSFCDFIENIQWSPDSTMIMVGLYKRGLIEIKQVRKPKWICRVDEGMEGITYGRFTPNSQNVLIYCQNHTKLFVRSLNNKSKKIIYLPKYDKKGIDFSNLKNFMVICTKKNAKDMIEIYYTQTWDLVNKFESSSEDLQDVLFTHDLSSIIISDAHYICKLLIYSLSGDLIKVIEPYKYKLGIRLSKITPNGHYLIIGCFDHIIRVYNTVAFTSVCEFDHYPFLKSDKVNYYFEEDIPKKNGESHFIHLNPPINLTYKNAHPTDKNIKKGIRNFCISEDSLFIASKDDSIGNVIFIWELVTLNLHSVIILKNEVTNFNWAPNMNCLYICSESSKIYLFKMDSISVIELPSNFYTQSVVLSKDGRKVILKDLNNFILMNFSVGENYFTFEPRKYNNTYNQRDIEEDDENAQTNLARKGDEDQYYDDNNGHYDNYDENNNYNNNDNNNYERNNYGEEGEMNPQGTFNNQNIPNQ